MINYFIIVKFIIQIFLIRILIKDHFILELRWDHQEHFDLNTIFLKLLIVLIKQEDKSNDCLSNLTVLSFISYQYFMEF